MNANDETVKASADDRDEGQTLALRLWIALARAHNAVQAHAADDVARHGLTVTEFAVLEALFHKGPMLLGEVQRRILVSSGGITWLVDRLEKRGLVERRPCPGDRRARLAALTPDGEALIRGIFPEHAARIKAALSGLGKKEKREAIRLLRALAEGAAAAPGGDGG
ncbi:MAG TPA: MarR family transcriptional regulator [Longimicrobium sp.]|nr:MarR family transcriptional regulator [Longimicrobium sp.]